MRSEGELQLFQRAAGFGERAAIVSAGGTRSYADLLAAAGGWAALLAEGRAELEEERIAILVSAGFDHIAVQWGIWMAGATAVPLCLTHPEPELEHVLRDSGATRIVADGSRLESIASLAGRLDLKCIEVESCSPTEFAPAGPTSGRRALILYTSGTTARPKGVVLTHAQLQAQIQTLVQAWGWTPDDRILHVLPLHHTHGIVNACACALWSGAVCDMLPGFDAATVWDRFDAEAPTLFMAVPTIYSRLIEYWRQQPRDVQRRLSRACSKLRLMVSGSAALPVDVFEQWLKLSGHRLLERYGMTEIGMALSNPLDGQRRAGTVGLPLPGVEVRIVRDNEVSQAEGAAAGELQVRGPSVFLEYWRRPDLTRAAFDGEWFRTGDIVAVDDGYYRVLGRSSTDIIKSGGYKISALEIEAVLNRHPAILDCAVAGVADPRWGERVCAAVVLTDGSALTLEALREWGAQRLARYKLPHTLKPVPELPRNAMGKVVKSRVRRLFGNPTPGDPTDETL